MPQFAGDTPDVVLKDDSDKGFLDFLADIEMNSLELTKTINDLNTDMNEMSTGIKSSVNDIARVNQKEEMVQLHSFVKNQKKLQKLLIISVQN